MELRSSVEIPQDPSVPTPALPGLPQAALETRYEYKCLTGPRDVRVIGLESSADSRPLRCRIRHQDLSTLDCKYQY